MERMRKLLGRAAPICKLAARILGLYLDDLCLLGACVCTAAAVRGLAGGDWALLSVAGWLTVYALVIARSRRGGGGR